MLKSASQGCSRAQQHVEAEGSAYYIVSLSVVEVLGGLAGMHTWQMAYMSCYLDFLKSSRYLDSGNNVSGCVSEGGLGEHR